MKLPSETFEKSLYSLFIINIIVYWKKFIHAKLYMCAYVHFVLYEIFSNFMYTVSWRNYHTEVSFCFLSFRACRLCQFIFGKLHFICDKTTRNFKYEHFQNGILSEIVRNALVTKKVHFSGIYIIADIWFIIKRMYFPKVYTIADISITITETNLKYVEC